MKKFTLSIVLIFVFCANVNAGNVNLGWLWGSVIFPTEVRQGTGENSDDYIATFYVVIPARIPKDFSVAVYSKNPCNSEHIVKHHGLPVYGSPACYYYNVTDEYYCSLELLTKNGFVDISDENGCEADASSVFLSFSSSEIYAW